MLEANSFVNQFRMDMYVEYILALAQAVHSLRLGLISYDVLRANTAPGWHGGCLSHVRLLKPSGRL